MICGNCGSALPDDSVFCSRCGAVVVTEVPESAEGRADVGESRPRAPEPSAEAVRGVPESSPRPTKGKKAGRFSVPMFILLLAAFGVLAYLRNRSERMWSEIRSRTDAVYDSLMNRFGGRAP